MQFDDSLGRDLIAGALLGHIHSAPLVLLLRRKRRGFFRMNARTASMRNEPTSGTACTPSSSVVRGSAGRTSRRAALEYRRLYACEASPRAGGLVRLYVAARPHQRYTARMQASHEFRDPLYRAINHSFS